MARIMKDSGIEWAGLIPDSWDSMSFWQAIERMGTGLNPRDNFELTKDDSCYYVTIRNFKDGVLYLDDNCDRISEKAWAIIQERSDLHSGDILFASISKDGQAYILKTEAKNWNINESVFCIRINKNLYQNRFFYYHLINVAYYDDLRRDATGSTFQSIKQNKLRKSRLLHPSLPEQVSIATYLDTECSRIDSVIEQTRASIEEYKKLKQAVITQAVTKGIRPNREMKDSGIEWIGDIPAAWEKANAHRIIDSTQNGLTRRDLEQSVGQIVLKLKNISPSGNIDYSFINRITLSTDEITKYALQDGDFLFVRVNGSKSLVGKCAVFSSIGNVVAYNDHIIRVRLNDLVDKKFFKYYLLSHVGRIEIDIRTSTAAGQYTISGEGLREVTILLPPKDEQLEIALFLNNKCRDIDTMIKIKQALITELETYKKSLIFEYVTGKKEVL